MALGQLSGIGEMLPNPYLLIRPFLRREAVSSSRIEGTQASLSDLFFFEAATPVTPDVPDVVEVYNYVRALEHALKRLAELPLSLRLIREVHGILMENVRGSESTPGEFRRAQNWIGPPGSSLQDATYVPPPVDEMKAALSAWEKHLHAPKDIPLLVELALLHYQFEAIHPFADGNGRVGRLFIPLLLCERAVLTEPLLYLSSFFEQHRDDYYRLLLGVSRDGAWTEWVRFFLNGVRLAAKDATRRAQRLQELQADYRRRLQKARSSALITRLLDMLFELPTITVPYVAKALDVTYRSAQNNVKKLIDAEILEEITGQDRNRIYRATEILRVLEQRVAGE